MHCIITKLTRIIIAFGLILSLSACGTSTSAGGPASEKTPVPATKPVQTPEAEENETPAETVTEEAPAEQPSVSMPAVDPSSIMERLGDADPTGLVSSFSEGLSGLTSALTSGGYEDIYNEYSKKLTDKGTSLLQEYRTEAASNTNGIEGLAEIANSKVEELAEIDVEGTEAMAQCMYTKGSGSYDEYEEWASKLYEVYNTEATKIYNEYMSSVR